MANWKLQCAMWNGECRAVRPNAAPRGRARAPRATAVRAVREPVVQIEGRRRAREFQERRSYKGWICFRACETADAGVNSTLAFVISRFLLTERTVHTTQSDLQFKQYVLAPLWVDFYFREQARHFELVPSRETASSGSQLG